MKKGIIIAGIASIVFFTSIIAAVLSSTNSIGDSDADSHSNNSSSSSSSSEQLSTASASNAVSVDVVMPTKSSRPGCEENDACYIPSTITISRGESVTWKNTDSAFHSVTSGSYDQPNDDFDSGHMDPNEIFTVKFDEPGTIHYFCKLHPWMAGKVVVE